MKKLHVITLLLSITLFTGRIYSQSTIIIDNLDNKPVPVKLTNPSPVVAPQTRVPFTQLSQATSGATTTTLKIDGPADSTSYKVIEYVLASSPSSSAMTMIYKTATFTFFMNTDYNAVNIVLKKGESLTFQIPGTGLYILATGYLLK